jgi:hypothetical protein
VTVFRKTKSSKSVRASGRPGPGDPVDTAFCTQIWQRDSFCGPIYYLNFPSCRKKYRCCHAAVVFFIPAELLIISKFNLFLICLTQTLKSWVFQTWLPKFELASLPHLHPAIFFFSAHSTRCHGSKKVCPQFISLFYGEKVMVVGLVAAFDFRAIIIRHTKVD